MDIFVKNSVDIATVLAESGQGAAIVALWDYFPFTQVLFPVLMVYGFVSMQTLLNGQCYSMAMITTRSLVGDEEPPVWMCIFWSLGIGAISISLLLIGGIAPAQTVSIVASVPLSIVVIIMIVSFFKDLRRKGWVENGEVVPIEGFTVVEEDSEELVPEEGTPAPVLAEP